MKWSVPKKQVWVFLALVALIKPAVAATALKAGDIAIIGANFLSADRNIKFVSLVDIEPGTVIYLTDYGWDGANGKFYVSSVSNTSEGLFTWTVSSAISAGTVFKLAFSIAGAPSTRTFINLRTGTDITSDLAKVRGHSVVATLTDTGDNFFIYQAASNDASYGGTPIPVQNPLFICGFSNYTSANNAQTSVNDATGWTDASNTITIGYANVSWLPGATGTQGGLVNGISAIGMTGSLRVANVWYTGLTTATDASTWASRINNTANWSGDATGTIGTSIGVAITLPVTLTSFTAKALQSQVVLNWQTISELNFSHFNLQRSTDGTVFNPIHRKDALLYSSGIKNYSYTDQDVLGFSTLYYRLEMIDRDGTTKYSDIKAVKLIAKVTAIYPNPVTNGYLHVKATGVFPLSYKIFNTGGQFLQSGVISTSNEAIDVVGLNSGTYVLKLDNGTQSHVIVK